MKDEKIEVSAKDMHNCLCWVNYIQGIINGIGEGKPSNPQKEAFAFCNDVINCLEKYLFCNDNKEEEHKEEKDGD